MTNTQTTWAFLYETEWEESSDTFSIITSDPTGLATPRIPFLQIPSGIYKYGEFLFLIDQ